MWHWTLKSLLNAPLTLLTSVAATSAAFLLVILFEAVFAGESKQIVAYPENADADIWVMQSGVSNMHMATSYMADWKMADIREVPGVAEIDGILYLNTVSETAGQRWFTYVVGLDVAGTLAGPWMMEAGTDQPGPGEAVVPAAFAAVAGLSLGDTLQIADHEFMITGLSRGTFSMSNSIVFVTRTDLENIMSALDIVSFVLVKIESGGNATSIASDIERSVEDISALPAEQFIENDRQMAMQMGVETIAIMTLIGGALAALMIAFTIYSQVARQRRELAVAKALGATNRLLYACVAGQALAVALASMTLAVLLAILAIPLINALIPQLTLALTGTSVVRVSLVGIVVALLASFIPARQIASVDPLSAFQAR